EGESLEQRRRSIEARLLREGLERFLPIVVLRPLVDRLGEPCGLFVGRLRSIGLRFRFALEDVEDAHFRVVAVSRRLARWGSGPCRWGARGNLTSGRSN